MIHCHLYKMFSEVFLKWVSSIPFPLLCKIRLFFPQNYPNTSSQLVTLILNSSIHYLLQVFLKKNKVVCIPIFKNVSFIFPLNQLHLNLGEGSRGEARMVVEPHSVVPHLPWGGFGGRRCQSLWWMIPLHCQGHLRDFPRILNTYGIHGDFLFFFFLNSDMTLPNIWVK